METNEAADVGAHGREVPVTPVVAVLIILTSGMGVFSAMSATGKGIGVLGVILSVAVIALVALPGARRTHS